MDGKIGHLEAHDCHQSTFLWSLTCDVQGQRKQAHTKKLAVVQSDKKFAPLCIELIPKHGAINMRP